jgi:hypothetical protein
VVASLIVTVCAVVYVPAATLKVGVAAAGVAAVPVPLSATVCGDPLALSVRVNVPGRVPLAVGANVTEIVQFAPAATLDPQLLVSPKSPEAAIDVTESAAVPELVSVTVCAALVVLTVWEAKVRLVGETAAVGPDPVPVRVTTCGLPGPSSAMLSVPVRVPPCAGLNLTLMAQALPVLMPPLQLSVSEKSPVVVIPDTFSARLPVLLKSNVCAEELCPTAVVGKVRIEDAGCPSPMNPVPMPVMM